MDFVDKNGESFVVKLIIMETNTKIHDSIIYWFYKYVFFGILLTINLFLLIEFIFNLNADIFFVFPIITTISLGLFIFFQFRFKRLYLVNGSLKMKGFFFGSSELNIESNELVLRKERFFSFGLRELFIINNTSKKSKVVICYSSKIKILQKANFRVLDEKN